jgi:hypothetical protein
MNTMEKIQWLIENEGCELADGYNGLQTFFAYCCEREEQQKILRIIKDQVNEAYDLAKEEYDHEQERSAPKDAKIRDAIDLILSDLGNNGFDTSILDANAQNDIKKRLARTLKNVL